MNHSETATLKEAEHDKRGLRRERLREFQSQLLGKMEDAKANNVVSTNQLGIMIGHTRYLLNLREAGEIISVGQITPVPLTREWYLGVLNIRGSLIGVIDLQRFQDQPAIENNSDCRIIAFSSRLLFNAGLLVTKVLGLRNVAEMNVQEKEVPGKEAWLRQKFLDANQEAWQELSLSHLIKNGDFLHIGL